MDLLKLISLFVQVLLWLKVVLSPVLGSAFVAFLICYSMDELNIYVITVCLSIALISGIYWAEKVRRGVGLSFFNGKLIVSNIEATDLEKTLIDLFSPNFTVKEIIVL